MIALPIAAFILIWLILRKHEVENRVALLAAATFLGSATIVITEILSVPGLLTRGSVACSWLVVCIGCAACLALSRSKISSPQSQQDDGYPGKLDRFSKTLLGTCGIIALLVGITALVAPPSGDDSMVYHLPRIMIWISNHNVNFFPTANYTQLIYGAFSEYSIMHTILLWGSDRFTNTINFFCFLGCPIAVSYITKLFGGGPKIQVLSAVICMTIPEGILEASGPMNTYAGAFWIATAAAFLLAAREDSSWLNTICLGLAGGLAVFTKGTSYIFLPFIVAGCWCALPGPARAVVLKRSAIILGLALALNAPQYVRNYEFDGSPLGLPLNYGAVQFRIENAGIRSTLANILRNISLHAGAPVQSLNAKIEGAFRKSIQLLGADPDDPKQVIWGDRFRVNHLSFNEIIAGNPFHLILLIIATTIVFLRFKRPENRVLVWYALGLTGAFLAFCALLKWQMWSSRYHLPLFVLGASIIALTAERYLAPKLIVLLSITLIAIGLLNCSLNRYRSLIPLGSWVSIYAPRSMLYFAGDNERLASSSIAIANAVNDTNCGRMAIDSYTPLSDPQLTDPPDSFFTYPVMALTHVDGQKRATWFTSVHNLSARYAENRPHAPACAVVCLDCAKVPAKLEEYAWLPHHEIFGNSILFTQKTVHPILPK